MTGDWLVIAPVAWVLILFGLVELRRRDQRRLDADRRMFRLHFPSEMTADAVIAFVRTLAVLRSRRRLATGIPSAVFEVAVEAGQIEYRLRLPLHRADELVHQLRVAIPGIDIEPVTEPAPPPTMAVSELRLSASDRALRTDHPGSIVAALLAAVKSEPGERILIQYAVSAALPSSTPTSILSSQSKSSPLWATLLGLVNRGGQPIASLAEWRAKHAEPVTTTALRIGAQAATPGRAGALVRRQVAVLHSVERPGVAFLRRQLPDRLIADRLQRGASPSFGTSMRLNARELALLIAWPIDNPQVPGLARQRARRLAPMREIPQVGRILGDSLVAGDPRPIAISAADSLHHLSITGPTGVGKSTLLANLAVQDVEAGRALVLIDPKRDLAEAVVDRIPSDRTGDVIWLDLSDTQRPVGMNALEGAHRAPERVADLVLGIFTRRYGTQLGPRSRDLLHAGLLTIARVPGMTLAELPALLVDAGFRTRLLSQGHSDRVLSQFWAAFEAVSVAERATITAPLMNKLRTYVLDPRIRACIGQAEPTWTMEQVLNERKILLVALDRGQLGGEAAALVGSLVVTMVWEAVQRRAVRLPAAIILDEFQDVVATDTDLGDILAKARSYGVGVCLAHQHLSQLDSALRAAVAANARTKVVFQTGSDDATTLARQLGGGLTPTDLMGLGAHQAYASIYTWGEVMPPASLATRPLLPTRGTAQVVRALSRQRFGRHRAEVEAAMARRQDGATPEGGLGRRRRSS